MVWVGKEGALGTGVGGNCSSGMDGAETITRRYPGRGSVYDSGRFLYISQNQACVLVCIFLHLC